jgi:hypothetical protein
MWILKSYENSLPGNYVYTQTIGIRHTFPSGPVIEELVKLVSAFRIANNLPRASLAETLEDVDTYQCAVQNNNPDYCRDCEGCFEQARSSHRFFAAPCSSCGTPVKTN